MVNQNQLRKPWKNWLWIGLPVFPCLKHTCKSKSVHVTNSFLCNYNSAIFLDMASSGWNLKKDQNISSDLNPASKITYWEVWSCYILYFFRFSKMANSGWNFEKDLKTLTDLNLAFEITPGSVLSRSALFFQTSKNSAIFCKKTLKKTAQNYFFSNSSFCLKFKIYFCLRFEFWLGPKIFHTFLQRYRVFVRLEVPLSGLHVPMYKQIK